MRGWHWIWRESRINQQGRHALSVGVRIGYWPCLRAVYMQLCFVNRRLEVWYGDDVHPLARRVKGVIR
jgi:hypothetical protein